jgi:exodeoxyribonuclease VII large subunit
VPFDLEDGLEIVVYAEATIYEARGELQLVIRQVEPRGTGALQLAFEQLRRSLEAEGLFDEARKRELPTMPRRLGLVTSARGAAVRDVLEVTGRRFPATPVLLSPTGVQGEGVELEIAAAIERVGRAPEVDVVLVVRGGGSLEDLWCFNTEPVVRAIVACPVPVISGVGHETDFTLADLAADVRAATPSTAAMLALPERDVLARRVAGEWEALVAATQRAVTARAQRLRAATDALRVLAPAPRLAAQGDRLRAALRALSRASSATALARSARFATANEGLAAARPRLEHRETRLAAATHALLRAASAGTEARQARFAGLAGQLDSLSPLAVLGRGYAVVRRASDGRLVREAADVESGERISLRVARAEIRAVVDSVEPLPTSDSDEPQTS